MNKFEQNRRAGLGQEGGLGAGAGRVGVGGEDSRVNIFLNRSPPPPFGQTDSQTLLKTLPPATSGKILVELH